MILNMKKSITSFLLFVVFLTVVVLVIPYPAAAKSDNSSKPEKSENSSVGQAKKEERTEQTAMVGKVEKVQGNTIVVEDKKQNIKCEQGQFFSPAYPDQRVSLARLAALCQAKGISSRFHGSYDPDALTGLDADTGTGTPYISCAAATQLAEVEVNTDTGAVKVLRLVAAQDVGKAINPRDVQGQIEGAIMMGLGLALLEEFVPGETRNFSQYRIPRMKDIPELIPLIVEVPDAAGPFGIKGLGECASLGTAPAIINALASAIGRRIFQLPATRKRVLEAIRTQTTSA